MTMREGLDMGGASEGASSGTSHDAPFRAHKLTGVSHIFAAWCNSSEGARRLWQETAFRHEMFACMVIFLVFTLVGAQPSEFAGMAVLLLGLAAAEALNTAIEEIIDRISPEWSPTGMHAKNLGSFAVFCLLSANALMCVFVVLSRLLSR